MTYSEWVFKTYGIKVRKEQMILPTFYIGYTKYCKDHGVKEQWHK